MSNIIKKTAIILLLLAFIYQAGKAQEINAWQVDSTMYNAPPKQFDEWVLAWCKKINFKQSTNIDTLTNTIKARVKLSMYIKENTLLEVINTIYRYYHIIKKSQQNEALSSIFANLNIIKFIDDLDKLLYSNDYLRGFILSLKASKLNGSTQKNQYIDSMALQTYERVIAIQDSLDTSIALSIYSAKTKAGLLLIGKNNAQADKYFIEVLKYEYWLLPKPIRKNHLESVLMFNAFQISYIEAALGRIEIYKGNLLKLQELNFPNQNREFICYSLKREIQHLGGKCLICD